MKTYDTIIIGFGKGGKTLAAELAARGETVAVIERSERMYGGTCINTGCIPTKALVHRASIAALRRELPFEEQAEYYRRSIEWKDRVVEELRQRNYRSLADNPAIAVYTGHGSFASADEVDVALPEGTVRLKGRRIVVNTGAETVLPPIPGIGGNPRVFTSTTLLSLGELPRRLVIVGGGYIGLEYASIYASFGSEVTVLEGFPELIPREDRDIAAEVMRVMERQGVRFHLDARVRSIGSTADEAIVAFTDGTGSEHELRAEAVLLATGRKPRTEGLNLAAAGIETDERGAIRVDERLHTTAPNVYAIGDVKGGLQFTYISLDDYRIIRDELFGNGGRTTQNRGPVSYAVFIDPPLARVGLSEEEARARGLDVRVKTITVASIPRVRTLERTDGVLKSVTDARTGAILGCTFFGPEAHEVINTISVAMKANLGAAFLRDFIFTHPSMSESFNELFA